MFTVYIFDKLGKRYMRILMMESEGLFNIILPTLPYERVYSKKGRGAKFIPWHEGLKLKEIGILH